MTLDLKYMTRKELEKHKKNVEKAIAKLAEKDKKTALAAAQKAAAAHGFSLAEITGETAGPKRQKVKSSPKTVSAPKYRNPDNTDQTWTGKGRQPEWFKAAIVAGTSPSAMEI
jgi:DNA-binding protein H-NS